jgi:hypothetical protein
MKPGKFIDDNGSVRIYEAGTPAELHVIHYAVEEPGSNVDGAEAMLTHWYPSEDEIRRLIDGKPVALSIVGTSHPWVKVEVSE